MHSKLSHGLGEPSIVGGDGTTITSCTEVFGGEETKAAHITEASYRLTSPGGASRLGAVFDHLEVVGGGNGHASGHVHRTTEQMHWNQCLTAWCDHCFDLIEVDEVRGWVDIHKYGSGANGTDRFRCGEKTKRAGDHLITSPHP